MKSKNLKKLARVTGPKRAGLYARVSTEAQLDNTSPDSQLRRCREYCQQRGYAIITEKIESIGGSFILARSKYNELLTMLGNGEIDVIVCDIPDRLGRGDAIPVCEHLARMNSGAVEYASPGRDASTVEGFIQMSAEQLVSGIERLNIRRRMTQGRRDKARRGQVIASPFATFGYRFIRHFDELRHKLGVEMVISEQEAQVVKTIYAWFVVDGLSLHQIARRLTDTQTPTPRDARARRWRALLRSRRAVLPRPRAAVPLSLGSAPPVRVPAPPGRAGVLRAHAAVRLAPV